MRKEELHFATYFSAKQTTENRKEVLRLAFCSVLRRNKHAHNVKGHIVSGVESNIQKVVSPEVTDMIVKSENTPMIFRFLSKI